MRLGITLLIASALIAPAARAQSVQYKPRTGLEFRSLPDTGGVARAQQDLDKDPRNVEKIIALGVAQSAIRQFNEAIATFTKGIVIDPKNALLYRWRGHRYISIGAFDKAIADLTRGLALDSTMYAIWYHLGVARFETGDFGKAADAFARARPRAPDVNEFAGATDWLWMSLSRAGRGAEAKQMLDAQPDTLKITTATAYETRLKLYRGAITAMQALSPADTAPIQVATISFGVGNWYLVRGDTTRAVAWFTHAVSSRGWPAFAFFAAETELQKLPK